MAELIIEITKIKDKKDHPNATSLDLYTVYDWQCISGKDQFEVDDEVIFIPPDSVLSEELENQLFGTTKVKLKNHRLRTVKIRGEISQGLIVDPIEYNLSYIKANVSKYEPPVAELPKHMQLTKTKKKGNSNFKKYTDIDNFKYFGKVFVEGEDVYVSEKLHGTSFRAGWFPMEVNSLWKKIKNFFGVLPEWEFCWGSKTVQIQVKGKHGGYRNEKQGVDFDDVYTEMVVKYDLKNVIPKGYAIYGEIVGDGIQGGYTYGCGPGEHKMYVYDVMDTVTSTYLDYFRVDHVGLTFASSDNGAFNLNAPASNRGPLFPMVVFEMGLERVPELYVGPYDADKMAELVNGDSVIGGQKIREGLVIKPTTEKQCSIGRKVLKYISDGYYLKNVENGTDFH